MALSTEIEKLEQMIQMMSEILPLLVKLLITMTMILIFLCILLFIMIKFAVMLLPRGKLDCINVGFFHPYCNAGGGGERVLWCAIRSLQRRYPNVQCYVYTGDIGASPEDITRRANDRFNIVLPRPVEFVYLRSRRIVEAKYYPVFTLLMQSVASIFLGVEAICNLNPDIMIDTMGYAFTYPMFRFIAGCKVVSYTHYPIISTDMLTVVANRVEAHNNRQIIARSTLLSFLKLIYYYIFAFIYFLTGRSAHAVAVNSTWTFGHIDALWRRGNKTMIVYPPCDVDKFKELPLQPAVRKKNGYIISIGQFRPEKNYPLQLRVFAKVLERVENPQTVRLVLIGGCRNLEDEARVNSLKELAVELGVSDQVIWKINCPFPELLDYVKDGLVGIHTMWNEHFGIGIVESMAGGLIMVAHDSGGPKLDIINHGENQTGYLASEVESYTNSIVDIFSKSTESLEQIQLNARADINRFSDEEFENRFLMCCENIFR